MGQFGFVPQIILPNATLFTKWRAGNSAALDHSTAVRRLNVRGGIPCLPPLRHGARLRAGDPQIERDPCRPRSNESGYEAMLQASFRHAEPDYTAFDDPAQKENVHTASEAHALNAL